MTQKVVFSQKLKTILKSEKGCQSIREFMATASLHETKTIHYMDGQGQEKTILARLVPVRG
jgi:peptide deformylase